MHSRGKAAFRKLNFSCQEGTLVRIAGPNGTGKTSLLRLLVGLMSPQEGKILWGGQEIKKLKEDFWKELVYIGHLNGVKDELAARENLLINAKSENIRSLLNMRTNALRRLDWKVLRTKSHVLFHKGKEGVWHWQDFMLPLMPSCGF